MITYLLAAWAAWILANLAAMFFVEQDGPSFNGFSIHIPAHYKELLTEDERRAIYAHECGHRHHWHVWKNFALVCFFLRASRKRRMEQEMEADDYAARVTHPLDLASALMKVSLHPADYWRAQRLIGLHKLQSGMTTHYCRAQEEKTV